MGHGTPPTAQGARARAAAEPQHRRRHDGPGRHVHADAVPVRRGPAARARGGVRRGQRGGAGAAHQPRGARVRDDRGRAGLRARGAHRLADARASRRTCRGALRPHERVPGDRPGLDGRPAGATRGTSNGIRRREGAQAGRRSWSTPTCAARATVRRRRSSTCSATPRSSRTGCRARVPTRTRTEPGAPARPCSRGMLDLVRLVVLHSRRSCAWARAPVQIPRGQGMDGRLRRVTTAAGASPCSGDVHGPAIDRRVSDVSRHCWIPSPAAGRGDGCAARGVRRAASRPPALRAAPPKAKPSRGISLVRGREQLRRADARGGEGGRQGAGREGDRASTRRTTRRSSSASCRRS